MIRPLIVDSHCHSGVAGVFIAPGTPDASLSRYARRAAEAGIDRTVLMAPPVSEYRDANFAVGAIVRSHPERFLGFVFVNPVGDRGRIADRVDEALGWGACGVKVHWSDGAITREVAEVAERRQLPVLFDPRGDIAIVKRIAEAYPDVGWIIPHLSSFADDWRAQMSLVDQLVRLPNLFADTAGVRYFDVLVEAVRRAGASKILFGTDGPFLHPGVELSKILALHLPKREAELVLGGNILRLTRLGRSTTRRSL